MRLVSDFPFVETPSPEEPRAAPDKGNAKDVEVAHELPRAEEERAEPTYQVMDVGGTLMMVCVGPDGMYML